MCGWSSFSIGVSLTLCNIQNGCIAVWKIILLLILESFTVADMVVTLGRNDTTKTYTSHSIVYYAGRLHHTTRSVWHTAHNFQVIIYKTRFGGGGGVCMCVVCLLEVMYLVVIISKL